MTLTAMAGSTAKPVANSFSGLQIRSACISTGLSIVAITALLAAVLL